MTRKQKIGRALLIAFVVYVAVCTVLGHGLKFTFDAPGPSCYSTGLDSTPGGGDEQMTVCP